jgi:allantoin racemase
MLHDLEAETEAGTEVAVVSLPRGPLHLRHRYYSALILPDLLQLLKEAEQQGFHAAIIGCFFDVGLQEAREALQRMAVVGPCEASVYIASTLCHRFSILVGARKAIPQISERLRTYGVLHRIASFKVVDIPVLGFRVDPIEASRRLHAVGQTAIEQDGAEALVLGCTAMSLHWRHLQAELGVAVINPVLASLKRAELAASLARRYGWLPSKVGAYELPPEDEMTEWGLVEQYGYGDPGHSYLVGARSPGDSRCWSTGETGV